MSKSGRAGTPGAPLTRLCVNRPNYRSNAFRMFVGRRFGVRSLQYLPFETLVGDAMKRIGAFLLLMALTVACSMPVQAQRVSPEESARQSQRAAKNQQKMLKHANKKQRKAAKKYEKRQRKQTKKANKTNRTSMQSVRRN